MIELQPFAAGDFQTAIIKPQQVQHGRVKIRDVVTLAHRVVAQFICFPVNVALLQTCSGQPDYKSVWMMITSRIAAASQFESRRATALRTTEQKGSENKKGLFS